MRNIFLYLLFVFSFVRAQNNVRLLSSDGSMFKVFKNERLLNRSPQASVLLEGISSDTLYMKLEFESGAKYGLTVYLLNKGLPVKSREFTYRILPAKNKLSVIFMGADSIQQLRTPIVPELPAARADTSIKKLLYGRLCTTESGHAIYYNNLPKTGSCLSAMPDTFLGYVAVLVKKAHSSDSKYSIAESVCNNNCLSVAQLNALLAYLPDEIDRLRLIKQAFYHVVDVQNQNALEKSFRLNVSVSELHSFLNHAGDHRIRSANACQSPSPEADIARLSDNLASLMGDAQRGAFLKKVYGDYCFSVSQVLFILQRFVHDREKADAAKTLYFNCTEKESYSKVSEVFAFPQYVNELKDFLEKQGQ